MKKLCLLALLLGQISFAQDEVPMLPGKNELRVDLLTIALRTEFNLTYERFLNKDWSVGVFGGYANSAKLNDDFDAGYRNNVPKYEVNPFIRYNLSKGQKSFYFAEVFLSANGGDFKETLRRADGSGNAYYVNEKSTYSDFGAGGGLGYKLYIKEKFAVEVGVGIGANLFNRDKSPDTISRVGLGVGYRF
jgi:hypothetical protein